MHYITYRSQVWGPHYCINFGIQPRDGERVHAIFLRGCGIDLRACVDRLRVLVDANLIVMEACDATDLETGERLPALDMLALMQMRQRRDPAMIDLRASPIAAHYVSLRIDLSAVPQAGDAAVEAIVLFG